MTAPVIVLPLLTLVLGAALAVAALATPGASAGPDTHQTFTFGFPQSYPAGTLCDFDYMDVFTATVKYELIDQSVIACRAT